MSLTQIARYFETRGLRVTRSPEIEGVSGAIHVPTLLAEDADGAWTVLFQMRGVVSGADVVDAYSDATDCEARAVLASTSGYTASARRWALRFGLELLDYAAVARVALEDARATEVALAESALAEVATPEDADLPEVADDAPLLTAFVDESLASMVTGPAHWTAREPFPVEDLVTAAVDATRLDAFVEETLATLDAPVDEPAPREPEVPRVGEEPRPDPLDVRRLLIADLEAAFVGFAGSLVVDEAAAVGPTPVPEAGAPVAVDDVLATVDAEFMAFPLSAPEPVAEVVDARPEAVLPLEALLVARAMEDMTAVLAAAEATEDSSEDEPQLLPWPLPERRAEDEQPLPWPIPAAAEAPAGDVSASAERLRALRRTLENEGANSFGENAQSSDGRSVWLRRLAASEDPVFAR